MAKTKTPKMKQNPKPFSIGRVKCRVIRSRETEPCYYWRAYVHTGVTKANLWCGWADLKEAKATVSSLVAKLGDDVPVASVNQSNKAGDISTVRALLEIWIAYIDESPRRTDRTKQLYRVGCKVIADKYGEIVLARVDSITISNWGDDFCRDKVGDRTAGNYITVFLAAWEWGRDRGMTPNIRLKCPDRSKYKDVMDNDGTYTDDEWKKIGGWFKVGSWAAIMCRLLEATGCRPGELAPLEWNDIDWERNQIRIRISKTGARNVPMGLGIRSYLSNLCPVADRKGRIMSEVCPATVLSGFRRHLKEACEALGIHYYPAKSVRHLTVDRLYRQGVDPKTSASILGHSDLTAMKYYRKVTDTDRANAVATAGLGDGWEDSPIDGNNVADNVVRIRSAK